VKIFLSYASEQQDVAETVAYTLQARVHFVFLDKKDLPAAETFDQQIGRAIHETDLLIFLISPEAVTAGRFTLTELKFARQRWPSAKGRVLPVLVRPTPLPTIPHYLSSLHILSPEGNVAAEVASEVDQIIPAARPSAIMPLALAMGLASGLISGLVGWGAVAGWRSVTRAAEDVFGSWIGAILEPLSFAAPYLFPLVVGTLLVRWDRTPVPRALLVFPVVAAAWICAYWVAFAIVAQYDQSVVRGFGSHAPAAQQCSGEFGTDEPDATRRREKAARMQFACDEIDKYRAQLDPVFLRLGVVVHIFAGLAAGFVGALLMAIGLGRLSRRLSSLDAIALITMVGTAAGILLVLRLTNPKHEFVVLFMVWHAAVAAAVAWQLTKSATREG
jgi:hypothetical protein